MIFQEIILHDFSRPLRERLESRKHVGPYHWTPTAPGSGRGFYTCSHGLSCARHGAGFSLRLELANDHLPNARVNGYYADNFQDSTLTPIVARLPHGRGYLAGWTMGAGMCATLDATLWDNVRDAAHEAHRIAERDAEKEREFQEQQDAESDDESE